MLYFTAIRGNVKRIKLIMFTGTWNAYTDKPVHWCYVFFPTRAARINYICRRVTQSIFQKTTCSRKTPERWVYPSRDLERDKAVKKTRVWELHCPYESFKGAPWQMEMWWYLYYFFNKLQYHMRFSAILGKPENCEILILDRRCVANLRFNALSYDSSTQ